METFKTFKPKHVEVMKEARDEVMGKIMKSIGVERLEDISNVALNKRGVVSKEQVCIWLDQMCGIVNQYMIPLLESALPLAEKCEELKTDKIKDQESIIRLQEELICKKDEEIKAVKLSVQNTVKTEITSYASAVNRTCAAALAPKNICNAIKSVADKEDRKRNVIIYGLEEKEEEVLTTRVEEVLLEIGEKPILKDCCRVGFRNASATRPIKFTLNSYDMVQQILRNAKLLRLKEGFKSVYICPDRTAEERAARKNQRDELRKKRELQKMEEYKS